MEIQQSGDGNISPGCRVWKYGKLGAGKSKGVNVVWLV